MGNYRDLVDRWEAERKARERARGLRRLWYRLCDGFWAVRRWVRWFRWGRGPLWKARNFYHRGRHGWAIPDTWSIDWYLDGWMPAAIRYLKEHNHGHPVVFTNEDGVDVWQRCEVEDWAEVPEDIVVEDFDPEQKWDEILEAIARGFEAHRQVCEDFINIKTPEGKALWEEHLRGMKLFIYNYSSLWD